MTPETEASIASCNNTAQLREIGKSKPDLIQAVQDSIEPVKILLADIMHRLKLKDKPFSVFTAASESNMKELWLELEQIDQCLQFNEKHQKKDLLNSPRLVQVQEDVDYADLYEWLRNFLLLSHSYLILSQERRVHYCPFNDVCGTPTFAIEEFRPSLQTSKSRQRTMPFSPSCPAREEYRHYMVQCQECKTWRLVYSKYELTTTERTMLNQALEDFTFTCGVVLSDLELGEESLDEEHLFMRGLRCYKPLEKLYYSVWPYELICIYCCSSENISPKQDCYPQCAACDNREAIKKRK